MTVTWDWPESGVKRKTHTVERLIFWSYASLSLTRQQMRAPGANPFPKGRSRATPALFKQYCEGKKKLGLLERETRLLALSTPCCLHCGSGNATEMDHLIPRSRGGLDIPNNTTTTCASCNRRRGNKDLMAWYRQNHLFPCLALMRHYLKLCHACAGKMLLLDTSPEIALIRGLPFDPRLLPSVYPPADQLIWDWRFPGK